MGPHSRQGGGHHGTPGYPRVLNVHDNGRRPCVSLLRPTYIPSCASVGDLFWGLSPCLGSSARSFWFSCPPLPFPFVCISLVFLPHLSAPSCVFCFFFFFSGFFFCFLSCFLMLFAPHCLEG